MRRITAFSATFCLALAAVAAAAVAVRADGLDDYIRTQMRRQHIPGCSIAVIRAGEVVTARGYGVANVETETPATPETVYKIGSVSKQFLAAAVMVLVQDGKLALDDTVTRYLDGAPTAWNRITVRHLLTHTSGIVRDEPGFDPSKDRPVGEVLASVFPLPLRFAPGEKWAYSNINYYALAEIIRKVSGEPWSAFVAERVFAPAKMDRTRTTTVSGIVPHRASGYTQSDDGLENAEVWVAVRPSGAFISSVLDFAKWDAALDSDTPLTAASRRQMWTPVTLADGTTHGYGFGWFVDSANGHAHVHHDGGVPGFTTDFERFPDDKLSVVVMTNSGDANTQKIARHVAGLYAPETAPQPEPALLDADPRVIEKVRAMISGFLAGHPDPSLFSADLAAKIDAHMIATLSEEFRVSGEIRTVTPVERRTLDDKVRFRFRLDYTNDTLDVICAFDRDGKIAGFGTSW